MVFDKRLYDFLKNLALIWLPALATLYFSLSKIWHLPAADEVTGTIVGIDTFLGIVLGFSTKTYNELEAKREVVFDGTLELGEGENEDTSSIRLTQVDPKALWEKDKVVFKVNRV